MDVTVVTELTINNTSYRVQDDSVVLQDDQVKCASSDDECMTDGDILVGDTDKTDAIGRYWCYVQYLFYRDQ